MQSGSLRGGQARGSADIVDGSVRLRAFLYVRTLRIGYIARTQLQLPSLGRLLVPVSSCWGPPGGKRRVSLVEQIEGSHPILCDWVFPP